MPYDAAAMLGFSKDGLISQILNGNPNEIPYIDVSGTYLFSKKALEEWIYSKSIK